METRATKKKKKFCSLVRTENIAITTHFRMRPAYCGPTSQKMQLDVFQVNKTFAWLARLLLLSAFLRAIKVIDCLTDVLTDLLIG